MNRNILKIIAVITMLIDHIGWILFPDVLLFRIVGRFAYPIYAFFIAQGMIYTHSRKNYIIRTLIFALISQIPYQFIISAHGEFGLNILFSFVLAELMITLLDQIKQTHQINHIVFLCNTIFVSVVLDGFGFLSYGCLGILLIMNFYYYKDTKIQYLFAFIVFLLMGLQCSLSGGVNWIMMYRALGIMSLPILYFYNNQKGILNLKYVFYAFYPIHLIILYIISLLI